MWAGPVLVALLSLTVFGWALPSEPHFVDESAYLSQSFYADLLLNGQWDDPAWLAYAGYDIPPLPKYVIGIALKLQGYRRPGPSAMIAWYQDIEREFTSNHEFTAARIPSVVLGMVGCLAIYGIGCVARDRRLGFVSALFLMANPLYALHARRAMSDVYAEAFILSAAVVGLWAWKRILSGKRTGLAWFALVLGSGIFGGLATLSKLNGALACLILGAWAILAILLPSFSNRRKFTVVTMTLLAGLVSFGTFAALNPFLYAHPQGPLNPNLETLARSGFLARVKAVSDHRVNVSDQAKRSFPHNALPTMLDKVETVAVQGFGRFGPFGPRGRTDSTIRFDTRQDRGAWVWLPWVFLGGVAAWFRGRSQLRLGEPPGAWAVLVQALLALGVVTAFIPLAWDRYFLSIQPGSALLGGFAVVEIIDVLRSMTHPRSLREDSP